MHSWCNVQYTQCLLCYKVVLVAPGAMRTEGMYGGGWFGGDRQAASSSSDISSPVNKAADSIAAAPSPSAQNRHTSSPHFLEEYAPLRSQAQQRYASIGGTEPGDPAKAMEALVDYVRREGAFASIGVFTFCRLRYLNHLWGTD
jgi:hypothetical protein